MGAPSATDVAADLDTVLQASPIQVPDDSIGFLLWQVTHRWQRKIEQVLEGVGVTNLQFVVLSMLAWLIRSEPGKPVTQARIACCAAIHPMQVSQVIKALESKHLVERRANPNDSRSWQLQLTPQGSRLLAKALPLVCHMHQEFFCEPRCNPQELKQILRALM